jgi:E3 ubiquitin-protein ligase synoviolin
MKALLVTFGTVILTAGVLANAYYQKKQFYPSVVYLTKSSPSMAVLYLQAFVIVIIAGKFMRKIFFGHLRAAEMEHLIERSWYAVTETCLAFTVFRDDFSPRFVALFTILLFLKCFHWLAEDRIDYMERSPVISVLFHIRAISLMTLLSVLDAHFISHAYHNTLIKGPSVQLVFGFEYAVLLTAVVHVFVKYILHTIDLQSDNPWENKAVYLLYTEVILGGIKVLFYLFFLAIMIKVHTFPLFIIRPMYLTVREFKKALNDVVMSRRAIRNMNTLYPDATPEELSAGDNVCIICREEMHAVCKKLPCNHIFHTSCLRSWFQRQQTCPTCRMDVLRIPVAADSNHVIPAHQPQAPPLVGQIDPNQFQAAFPLLPQNYMLPQMPYLPVTTASTSTSAEQGYVTQFPGPIPYGWPYAFPPMPPTNFSGLSIAELQNMEGRERQNIEARLQCLHDIQTLLNAALLQLQQYSTIAAGDLQHIPTQEPTSGLQSTNDIDNTLDAPSASSSELLIPSASGGAAGADDTAVGSESDVVGAVGYTKDQPDIDQFNLESGTDEDNGKIDEIRRRRLERFSSSNLSEHDKSD